MPLEHPDQKYFEEACGYAQLGMFTEANEALENVDAFNRAVPGSTSRPIRQPKVRGVVIAR